MCEPVYQPGEPLATQLDRLLHAFATWRDHVDVIAAQLPDLDQPGGSLDTAAAKGELRIAARDLHFARYHALQAFRLCLPAAGQEV